MGDSEESAGATGTAEVACTVAFSTILIIRLWIKGLSVEI